MADDEVSLRPLSLRPGGKGKSANPFAGFGKGAGFAVKKQVKLGTATDPPLAISLLAHRESSCRRSN